MASVYHSTIINAPLAKVWAVVGNFADVSWSGKATSSLVANGKGPSEVGAVRRVKLGEDKWLDEKLVQYSDSEPHFYTYEVTPPAEEGHSPLPAGVLGGRSTLRVESVTDGDRTFVAWRASFTLSSADHKAKVEEQITQSIATYLVGLQSAVSPKPKLTYFGLRGRAEVVRLLLEVAGVEYVDEQLGFEQFGALKGSLPFGQLPIYSDGEVKDLAQTHAIAYYVARKHRLYGETAAEASLIGMYVEAFRDIAEAVYKVMGNDLEADNKPLVDAVGPHLEKLEKLLAGKAWFVGNRVSLADVEAYFVIANLILPAAPNALDAFPGIKALVHRFAEGPAKAYLDSNRRPAIVLPPMVNKLYANPEKCAVKY